MSAPMRLLPGETDQPVDPVEVGRALYRGALWELARIGKPVPAVLMGVMLVLMLVFAIAGLPWPSIIVSAVLVGLVVWTQRSVLRWAAEHNDRVAAIAQPKPTSKPKRAKPVRNRRRP